jgi:hypothetical protein
MHFYLLLALASLSVVLARLPHGMRVFGVLDHMKTHAPPRTIRTFDNVEAKFAEKSFMSLSAINTGTVHSFTDTFSYGPGLSHPQSGILLRYDSTAQFKVTVAVQGADSVIYTVDPSVAVDKGFYYIPCGALPGLGVKKISSVRISIPDNATINVRDILFGTYL